MNDGCTLRLPGDKSIAHRVFMMAAMREGDTVISNVPACGDVAATIDVLRQLGASIEQCNVDTYQVHGWGNLGPQEPDVPLDCRNSGTTARLIMGVLAPWEIMATIDGDDSLRRRPMDRVTEPLSRMGVKFDGSILPISMRGTSRLKGISYEIPVASAQVKSAILLAGLHAEGKTTVYEPYPTRNHTELLIDGGWFAQCGTLHYEIPGDPSSAAFLIVQTILSRGASLCIRDLCLNDMRIGYIRALQRMGARISICYDGKRFGEPIGSVYVRTQDAAVPFRALCVENSEVPSLIDELPVLSVVAMCADGESVFFGVDELAVKESDRIAGIISGLTMLGVEAYASHHESGTALHIIGRPDCLAADGLYVSDGAVLDACGDHRLALTWLVARECARSGVEVRGAECMNVSYPGFTEDSMKISKKGMQ